LSRIIEIEWAVKHNKEFVPSPKRPKKAKSKKKGKNASGSGLKVELVEPKIEETDTRMDVDEEYDEKASQGKRKNGARFGSEVTNRLGEEQRNGDMESPFKRSRVDGSGDEDWAITKKARRKALDTTAD
jgi:kinesin family member 22